MANDRDDQIPADQQVTRDIPADQPPVGASVPDDAPATVSAAQAPGAPRRRDRWRQLARPTSNRGRGLLAALAAVVLLLVGGAAGFAIGHADGDRGGDGGFAVQDGGREDGDGRGDRDGGGGRGDRDGDDSSSTTSPSTTSPSTTSPSTSSSSPSATPTT